MANCATKQESTSVLFERFVELSEAVPDEAQTSQVAAWATRSPAASDRTDTHSQCSRACVRFAELRMAPTRRVQQPSQPGVRARRRAQSHGAFDVHEGGIVVILLLEHVGATLVSADLADVIV